MRTKLVRDRLIEEKFAQYIKAKFPSDGKRGSSGVIHAAYADKIKQCLKDPEKFPKEFRYFVRKKNFRTFELPSLGLKDVLVIPRSENKEVSTVIFISIIIISQLAIMYSTDLEVLF